jgi:hypothetical protein
MRTSSILHSALPGRPISIKKQRLVALELAAAAVLLQ